MKLTVVGSAPAWTRRPGRASSCYLVEDGNRALVMDLGQGAFSELARWRPAESLGGVLISHLHPDHLVDLVPLRHYLRYEAGGAEVPLRAPRDLRRRLDELMDEDGFLAGLPGDALAPSEFELADFAVEARHVTHIDDSYAFRIAAPDGGPGLVYSGDCGVAADLLPLIRPGDTLLCEAAFGTEQAAGSQIHLTATQAAEVAALGGAARLVLTHILDRHAEAATAQAASAVFDGQIVIARPGLALNVGEASAG